MNAVLRGAGRLALALTVAAGAGCAQLGTLEDIAGAVLNPGGMGGGGQEVAGEVRRVDTRSQRLEIRTQDGRTGTVSFDNRTRVVYRQQEYQVTSLEQGDYVAMRVQQDSRGGAYTDYIVVQESVRDRGGTSTGSDARAQVMEGTAGYVDLQRGQFQLRTRSSGTVIVSLPYGARASEVDRFRRLREGDYVRVEVTYLGQQRVELYRFL